MHLVQEEAKKEIADGEVRAVYANGDAASQTEKKAARNEVMPKTWVYLSRCWSCVADSLGHSVGQL